VVGLFDAESIHRLNGTVAPLRAILGTMVEVVLYGQRTLIVVAGAHPMNFYRPGDRGMVTCSGWRTACQCSPGCTHSLVAPGAVLLTNTLIRNYLLNCARPIMYTASVSNPSAVIS